MVSSFAVLFLLVACALRGLGLKIGKVQASTFTAIMLSSQVQARELDSGELLFKSNCAFCHAHGGTALVAPTAKKTLSLEDLQANGLGTKQSIVELLKKGQGLMPAFKKSDDEVSAVAEFVLDTATSGGW